jgi:hypothetical protein
MLHLGLAENPRRAAFPALLMAGALMAAGGAPALAAASASLGSLCVQKGIAPVPRGDVQVLKASDPRLGALDYGWGPASAELDRLTKGIGGVPHGPSHAEFVRIDDSRLLHYTVCKAHHCGYRSINYLYNGRTNRGIALYYNAGQMHFLGHPTAAQRRQLLAAACTSYR